MTWFFKKRKEGITIRPNESLEIRFPTVWSRDEVLIMTRDGPVILNEKVQLFIEVSADNIDPVSIQIVPDFKNRTLNFVEIIDPNIKKKFESGPKLSFSFGQGELNFGELLGEWDKDIEKFDNHLKRYRWIRNALVITNIFIIIMNIYFLMTFNTIYRYVNIAVILFSPIITYHLWSSYRRLDNKIKKFKDIREKSFGLVKEK